jgi:hypothetical protein
VPRRFSSEEVARILKRAAELQLADPTGRSPSSLNVEEMEQLAGEAGIERARLHAAIAELHGRARVPQGPWILGGPTRLYLERVVPVAIPAETLEDLLAEIRRVLEEVGNVSVLGGTLTWTSMPSQAQVIPVSVIVTRRETETRLVVEARLGNLAGGLFGGLGGGLGGGMAVPTGVLLGTVNPLLGAIVGVGLGVGSFVLARAIYARTARNRSARYLHLLNVLEERIRSVDI